MRMALFAKCHPPGVDEVHVTADSLRLTKNKMSRVEREAKRKAVAVPDLAKPVTLNFETQRVFNENKAVPVNQIMMTASYTEEFSFHPTVRIEHKELNPVLVNGETIQTKVGKMDYLKTQILMLFTIATLGLLIGFFIAFFI